MSLTTTVHVVKPGNPGVLIPPGRRQERHMVVEYGHVFETPIFVGTVYLHDMPEDDVQSRWLDHELQARMTSRCRVESEWPPAIPTVPHMRYPG